MPTIRPISDLRNKTQEISNICHESVVFTGSDVTLDKASRSTVRVYRVLHQRRAWEDLW